MKMRKKKLGTSDFSEHRNELGDFEEYAEILTELKRLRLRE